MRYALTLLILVFPLTAFGQPDGVKDLRSGWQIDQGVTVYTADGDTAWVISDSLWRARVGSEWHMQCPTEMPLAQCIDTFDTAYDSLTSALPDEKEFWYAQACRTHPDNATLHIPAAVEVSSEIGDTIAAITPRGSCAGYAVIGENGTTFAAAQEETLVAPYPDGFRSGDPIKLEIAGEPTQVTWASCDTVDVPMCAEGEYNNGTIHQVATVE